MNKCFDCVLYLYKAWIALFQAIGTNALFKVCFDHAIEVMLHAKSQEEFEAAVRAEDRLLVAGFYMVPLFTTDQWVGRWARIGSNPPDKQPLPGFEGTTLWFEKQ